MGSFQSFAQELENKIRKELQAQLAQELHASNEGKGPVSAGSSSSSAHSGDTPSELWSFLVGNLDPVRFQASTKGQAYHAQKKPGTVKPPHLLNALQTWAADFFAQRGVVLSPRFSAKELQSAFRKLALRMHPDQGGSPVDFQNLMSARSELAQLF